MKFCKLCDNFLYDMVEKDGGMVIKCRKTECTYEESVTKENPVVYERNFDVDTSVQLSINPYLKYDMTLPRFSTMVCPNRACATRGKESDIVGVKLDAINVVWMYQCAVCDSMWKQSANGAKS
uniref:DNA-directed RNA polymerase M/15kDa subunit domain-containing protein n=1 Tax=viral metagenome TaxID=1070528 RepID=A0A6C0J8Q0_9ZZZZ